MNLKKALSDISERTLISNNPFISITNGNLGLNLESPNILSYIVNLLVLHYCIVIFNSKLKTQILDFNFLAQIDYTSKPFSWIRYFRDTPKEKLH